MIWIGLYLSVGAATLIASLVYAEEGYLITLGEILFAFSLGPISLAVGVVLMFIQWASRALKRRAEHDG